MDTRTSLNNNLYNIPSTSKTKHTPAHKAVRLIQLNPLNPMQSNKNIAPLRETVAQVPPQRQIQTPVDRCRDHILNHKSTLHPTTTSIHSTTSNFRQNSRQATVKILVVCECIL
jgi:hypothetical protein